MALKPDRIELPTGSRIKYFMNVVAEAGIICNISSPGGAGMDNPAATLFIPTGPSGHPAGMLMNDVVNLDLTRQHLNQHKDEVQIGNKVAIMKNGYAETNMLKGGDTPNAGDACYYTTLGVVTSSVTSSNRIGTFAGPVDSDGYIGVELNIT